MANRYWVGGTASWDGTAGTKWATTSGGAGGASVPTSADDVFFDAASTGTCTISAGNTGAKSITCTGFTGTLSFSATISLSGNLTLVAGMTVTGSGSIQFIATGTITSAGKTLSAITVIGSGITVDLADALTSSGAITVTQGTFTTNNYNVTATSISSSNSNTRTINLGSSTVTLSGSTGVACATSTGLTFNAGTSTIVMNGSGGGTINIGNLTTPGAAVYNISGTYTAGATSYILTGVTSANNISIAAPAVAGVSFCSFQNPCTINGTLSTTGTAGNRRVWFRAQNYGLAQTLTINSAPSLTDADFRDIYVVGTAAPISGTRIGDLRGNLGITFSTPKTVYWVTAAGGNWSGNNWAATSGGAASTDNFPLAQDTAIIENTGLNTSATVTMDSAISYTGGIDMSTRTNAMTLATNTLYTIYGNWTNGSGTTFGGSGLGQTFSGRNTQTITSAGKTFNGLITIDSYGGTVQLADALNIGANTLTVTNGTFDTKNYNVTAGALSSSNTNVRTITLGSSTVTLSGTSPLSFGFVNLTFNCGTSSIVCSSASTVSFSGAFQTFYDVSFTGAGGLRQLSTAATYRNLSFTATAAAGFTEVSVLADQTITGTLTVAGATAVRRVFVRSSVLGTTRTLTVNSLSATDCDFRDITIAGTAAGSSPTRAGDCGGNTGITFPAPKTVYWNLAGAQNWSATGWASSSGGSPDINNFPLAQDTAVFDNTGSVTGAITFNAAWNIGTFDASARTSAMTLNPAASPTFYGSFLYGTGVTVSSSANIFNFSGRGTQTITSNGVTTTNNITIDCFTGTVQLADALTLSSTRTLTLTSGTFDAVSYNVTTGLFSHSGTTATLKMGSGTWTLSGTGTVWTSAGVSTLTFYKGTANIVLSDTSTTARTFNGGGLSFNKLTIGGATGTSTLTINNNNQFTELASTKTVAHTIALGTTTQTFGKWSVTGTAGNVVTVTGTATIIIAGAAVSGVDYLAMGTTAVSATSPGEFYSGANSTGTGANVIKTAAPAPRTLYWVGGTGNWSSTTKWSTSSGGASGAAIPTSLDDVVFDSLSNATAYTATIDPTQARCKSLTIAGPLVGNVTIAGTGGLACHGSVSLAATGITRTYTGAITLSGSSTGLTFTTNGVALNSVLTLNGVGCEWTLGSALQGISNCIIQNGSFLLSTYNLSCTQLASAYGNSRTINLGSSTVSISIGATNSLDFGLSETERANLSFSCGTSQINFTGSGGGLRGNNQTFYNVAYTNTSANQTVTLGGANTFNNLSVTGITSAGLKEISISANQTINGTLTFSAGTNATMRHFARSDTLGTTRTLTCASFSGTDVDFRDITIAGAAAPVSGTRLGDCKGNSGITFDAPKTVYWAATTGESFAYAFGAFSLTLGGAGSLNNFPLAQDTIVFPSSYPNSGQTCTIAAAYNIGTIDMSARTSNTMTLATGSTAPTIYGNWINGTGTTLTGTGAMTFAGRGSQTITSAGVTFTQPMSFNTPGGSVTLQDAFSATGATYSVVAGTFDAATYNVTINNGGGAFLTSGSATKVIATGSGTWSFPSTAGVAWNTSATGVSVTGTATVSLGGASAKTFNGGGLNLSGITLNQGGAGTLTITGNNTFKNITNSYSATGATNITLGTTTQTVTQFTATGTSGKVLTVQGSSASSPGTLILTSGTVTTPDYLAITGVRAYSLTDTWYAGANSTNNGSLGWYFSAGSAPVVLSTGNFFFFF